MQLGYLITVALVLAAAGPAAAQPTNALPGQPPIVTNGVVLPDSTFVQSTWLQAASEFPPVPMLPCNGSLRSFDCSPRVLKKGSKDTTLWAACDFFL